MKLRTFFFLRNPSQVYKGLIAVGLLGIALGFIAQAGLARTREIPSPQASPMHPNFPLLDENGENVLESQQPVSAMETCGACHDTEFIATHSEHATRGLDEFPNPGERAAAPIEGLEMQCFLCHTAAPDNESRIEAIQNGQVAWASTATLLKSGIVAMEKDTYRYLPEAFSETGELLAEFVQIQDPQNDNCGQCHGAVHTDLEEPFTFPDDVLKEWRGATTGQVISPQKMSDSGMNLAGKDGLSRSFDVHAARSLECTDCHFSLNNPVYFEESTATRPEHLAFDPRRLELGEYLKRPVHDFAHGVEDGQVPSMRRCESCHSLETTHNWLPYKERHAEMVSCETCHIPEMRTPAFQTVDWTAPGVDGSPQIELRGVEESGLMVGYEPVLLSRKDADGETKLSPYNLVASWYWVHSEPAQPVSQENVEAAWYDGIQYRPEVLAGLDADGNGILEDRELVLDTPEKTQVIASQLEKLGFSNPRITGEVQPYSLNHSVAESDWATRDCKTCHGDNSLLDAPFLVSSSIPGGILPEFADQSGAQVQGELYESGGRLYYRPAPEKAGLYILGSHSVSWIDLLGSLAFAGVLLGVVAHSGFRFYMALRQPRHTPELKRVYMYSFYERLWHWLQTFTILGLLFTGLIIHKPDTFGIFSFRYVVLVHNILAGILVTNAALSLFYHLASGEIRQYIPRPAGFFDQAIVQAKYYLGGIFRGEPHPFEKKPDKKLNPLQQATYFGILNVLLPLQMITGALMWGVQQWPDLTNRLGGLPFLAPFHSLIAWLFASFVVMHVYLTTTNHTPLASIQAMLMGWDEIETAVSAEEVGD